MSFLAFPWLVARAGQKTAWLLLFCLALATDIAQSAEHASHNLSPSRVLMIFSEGKDLPGNIILEQSFRSELQRQSKKPLEFFIEHMDASHFSNKALYQIFRDYLAAKYAGENLDLLMIFLGRDFKLAEDLPVQVFTNVPAVFVTASEMEVPQSLAQRKMPGIIQRFAPAATVGLLRRLQPEVQRIVVVGGTSEADRKALSRIEEVSRSMPEIQFEFWTNQSTKELLEPASELPKNTALLLSTILADAAGQTFYMSQAAQLLAPSASVPIYALSGSAVGNGALGGAAVDPETLGVDVARLALRMLENPSGPTWMIERTNVSLMVDWREMRRWEISSQRLPKGCLQRFKPRTLWEEHKRFISIAVAVFLAQALTIAALLAQREHRRRAEAEIQRQRTELAHVTRVSAMGQLAAALAHEINQPLGAILRNAEAAEIFLEGKNPDLQELRAILADIRKDDQRAAGVIDRMRTLLKRKNLESRALDLRDILEETVALARPDAQARHVRLALEVLGRLPCVRGDRVHLQQVVLNLILNAMDAANDTGQSESVVTIRAAAENGQVQVKVLDCGPGVPTAEMGRVFEPFFTTKPNGMGMGLAISRTIIEAHGGTIRAENNPSGGAVFQFTLPSNPG